MIKVTTIKVRDVDYDVSVSERGEFYADVQQSQLNGKSLEELRDKITKATSKLRISIPFCRWEGTNGGKLVHGEITGRHASNRNLMVKIEDRKSEQEYGYSNNEYLRLTQDEELAYSKLCYAFEAARVAKLEFKEAHQIPVREAVEEEYAKLGKE